MNLAETHDLLTFIAVYDNRRFDDAAVHGWHRIVADIDFADAETAVVEHFATSDAYLMPVHIRRLVAELHRARVRQLNEAQREKALAIEAADPTRGDRSEHIEALVAETRSRLRPGNADLLRHAAGHWRRVREDRKRQEHAVPNPDFDPAALGRLAQTTSQEQA